VKLTIRTIWRAPTKRDDEVKYLLRPEGLDKAMATAGFTQVWLGRVPTGPERRGTP
jgi:hypothetical protein